MTPANPPTPGAPDGSPGGSPDPAADAPHTASDAARRKRRARWLYARVMIVQVVALVLLWLLQATYGN